MTEILHTYCKEITILIWLLAGGLTLLAYRHMRRSAWVKGSSVLLVAILLIMASRLSWRYQEIYTRDGALHRIVDGGCFQHIKTCGEALLRYAGQHNGRFPDNLNDLAEDSTIYPFTFTCPGHGFPKTKLSGDPARWTDFTFVLGLTTNDPSSAAIVFCDPAYHAGKKVPVAFMSGETRWLSNEEFTKMMSDPRKLHGTTNQALLNDITKRAKLVPTRPEQPES